jgi:ABC-type multidrug transport system fused ATPase/permease subunit
MRLLASASLQPARVLATRRLRGRGAVVGVLALVERLLAPAAAWVLFEQTFAAVTLVLVFGAVFTLRHFVQRAFSSRAEAELADRVIASLLDGDVLRGAVLSDGDARAELGQAVYHTSQHLGTDLPVAIADLVAAAVLTVVIAATEPGRLVVFAVGLTVVAAAALAWSRSRIQKAVSRAWVLQERVFEQLVDALEARMEVVASGLRSRFLEESQARTRAWGSAGVRVASLAVLSGRLPLLAIAALVAAAIAADSRLLKGFGVTLADAALLASVTPAFAGVAQGLYASVRAERWVRLVAQVVEDARPTERGGSSPPRFPATIDSKGESAGVLPARWPIAFDRVSFRYEPAPGDADALQDVTFDWDGEQMLALVGANGSGKSTCLRLLIGLARPRAGGIRVGGVALPDLDVDAWRARVAFLPQRPYLPQRSDVRSAVRLLAPEAPDERILANLDRVGLLSGLRRAATPPLEVGVDTLSAGQRQRLALARLLCRDSSLLVLDEPDANLDREGISLVAGILRELARDRAVVFAAHTPELVAIADRVVTLDAGRLVRDERLPAGQASTAVGAP